MTNEPHDGPPCPATEVGDLAFGGATETCLGCLSGAGSGPTTGAATAKMANASYSDSSSHSKLLAGSSPPAEEKPRPKGDLFRFTAPS